MAKFSILTPDQYQRSVWKNGLGFTDQIAIFPANASLVQANFLWRMSSAHIENASPFSLFPEHDRILVILKGSGVRLSHQFEPGEPEDTYELPAHEVYEFPGDIASRCELINGPVTDLSVFLKRGVVDHAVALVEVEEGQAYEWPASGKWNFLYVIFGELKTSDTVVSAGSTIAFERAEQTGNVPAEIVAATPALLLRIELSSIL